MAERCETCRKLIDCGINVPAETCPRCHALAQGAGAASFATENDWARSDHFAAHAAQVGPLKGESDG